METELTTLRDYWNSFKQEAVHDNNGDDEDMEAVRKVFYSGCLAVHLVTKKALLRVKQHEASPQEVVDVLVGVENELIEYRNQLLGQARTIQ